MFSFRITAVTAVIFLLCFSAAVARSSPIMPHLANKVTPAYFVLNAETRTLNAESLGSWRNVKYNHGTRSSNALAPIQRRRPTRPKLFASRTISFRSQFGQVQAFKVEFVGHAIVHGLSLTSIYYYIYNRETGALLEYGNKPADRALAGRFGFPVNVGLSHEK